MDYDYEIHYKKGILNTNADAFSRIVYEEHSINQVQDEEMTFEYFKGFHQREVNIPASEMVKMPIKKISNVVIPLPQTYQIGTRIWNT